MQLGLTLSRPTHDHYAWIIEHDGGMWHGTLIVPAETPAEDCAKQIRDAVAAESDYPDEFLSAYAQGELSIVLVLSDAPCKAFWRER